MRSEIYFQGPLPQRRLEVPTPPHPSSFGLSSGMLEKEKKKEVQRLKDWKDVPRNLKWTVIVCAGLGAYIASERKPTTNSGFVISYAFFGGVIGVAGFMFDCWQKDRENEPCPEYKRYKKALLQFEAQQRN